MTGQKKVMAAAAILAILSAFLLYGVSYVLFPDVQSGPQPILAIFQVVPLSSIHIDSAGNVNPSTVPIQRNGDVYTLTGDIINYTLIVQRDNIVIDGAEHTLRGYVQGNIYGSEAIELSGRNNVTIKNIVIEQFWKAIVAQSSSDITISENTLRDLGSTGIALGSCNNTIIAKNNANNMATAIDISKSNELTHPSNNTITDNTITNAVTGIQIQSGALDNVSNNNFENIYTPIYVASNSTIISKNVMKNGIDAISLGGIYSDNNANYTGGSYCSIFENRAENFTDAVISINLSVNSTIYQNYLTNSTYGVVISRGGEWIVENNFFYHNNFVNNTQDILVGAPQYVNFWDNGKEGNYWSAYNGIDANNDGLGDTPFNFDAKNADRYPLMKIYGYWGTEQSILDLILGPLLLIGLAALVAFTIVGTGYFINSMLKKEKIEK
ncbi:MAG: NosD domain-containing protein [Thermoproteota archaeon]|nr:NosD domain-containing protein [Thermoproteota archaeon]NLD66467.1 hypothetical protein [Thermoproteota archaeon]